MTNIKDIAKYCNVSVMTVSRALNNSGEVADATKEKILKACEELKYKPNAAAKTLITKKTKMIGLIIPDIANQYYANISKGVSSYLESKDYGLILCNSDRKKINENKYLNFLSEGRVDGIIILPVKPKKGDYEDIVKQIPMVMADNFADGLNVNFVSSDNYIGGTKIIEHMVKQGYKNIGVILGDKESTASNNRFKAYKDVLEKNTIKYNKDIVVHSNSTFEEGFLMAEKLVKKGVDSIFAINDTVAMGVIKYCYENNIKLPEDLGIAGYDNIEQSSMLTLPLTTVDQNNKKIGLIAAQMLIYNIEGKVKEINNIILEPNIVIRKSCGEK
ncbi:transcriptional regulator, LacI family [Clostridium acidisoli DSM 12555]|uniref:Transcriptional regulator, LacI family n=1 Tax=Clostridium acidisoli DSM 12555 TaxID=1121291 RepID=A0A1W1XEL9_9CLOT|nr:LacI family DNA-binding transcriptional regulator [Clostridium acidisoli]SMC21931.1 transcriptional regulator, LacI family [Clostridium acidisoli DSM 12555]